MQKYPESYLPSHRTQRFQQTTSCLLLHVSLQYREYGIGLSRKKLDVDKVWDQKAIQDASPGEEEEKEEEGEGAGEDEGAGESEDEGAVGVAGSATMVDCRARTGRMGQKTMATAEEALAVAEEYGNAPVGVEVER